MNLAKMTRSEQSDQQTVVQHSQQEFESLLAISFRTNWRGSISIEIGPSNRRPQRGAHTWRKETDYDLQHPEPSRRKALFLNPQSRLGGLEAPVRPNDTEDEPQPCCGGTNRCIRTIRANYDWRANHPSGRRQIHLGGEFRRAFRRLRANIEWRTGQRAEYGQVWNERRGCRETAQFNSRAPASVAAQKASGIS
ncbi:uncharacterized protein LOC134205085 isoform X2 [Armigeres subalbatus]|uniref:uncharacterized protein LOC134205085 isoform X2 n=1 Tax=Armigeres subalbatus TaxID=124917 RepID=UPI002ED32E04